MDTYQSIFGDANKYLNIILLLQSCQTHQMNAIISIFASVGTPHVALRGISQDWDIVVITCGQMAAATNRHCKN